MEVDEHTQAATHLILGHALSRLNDPKGAGEQYIKATQLAPYLGTSWLALAQLQRESGQPNRAVDTLRAGAQAAPESPKYTWPWAKLTWTIGKVTGTQR